MRMHRVSIRQITDLALSVAMMTAAALLIARNWPSAKTPAQPLPTEPVPLADAISIGSEEAKVAILVYSEFQCPYCATFAKSTLGDIESAYVQPGLVKIAFRHLPLEEMHKFAFKAAEAAECAARQGTFRQAHDFLFANQAKLGDERTFTTLASDMKNKNAFERCLRAEAAEKVRRDMDQASALGVTGTPTFFVGAVLGQGSIRVTNRLRGAQPFAEFKKAIDPLLPSKRG